MGAVATFVLCCHGNEEPGQHLLCPEVAQRMAEALDEVMAGHLARKMELCKVGTTRPLAGAVHDRELRRQAI
jgi:hypothetical protein